MLSLCHDKLNGPSTGPLYQAGHGARLKVQRMIDTFGLAVSHGLILLAVWRLLWRPDLNDDRALPPPPSASAWPRFPGRKDRPGA